MYCISRYVCLEGAPSKPYEIVLEGAPSKPYEIVLEGAPSKPYEIVVWRMDPPNHTKSKTFRNT